MGRKTLAEKAADEIKKLIQENNYTAGMKLPTERQLCGMLGVGRNTLREAERILQSHNIVDIRQGSGTYVSEKAGVMDDPFNLAMVKDRQKLSGDILEILERLEPFAASLAAEKRTQQDVERLERSLQGIGECMRNEKSILDAECLFFQQISACTGNLIMMRMTPIVNEFLEMLDKQRDVVNERTAYENYLAVMNAVRDKKPQAARLAMEYQILELQKIWRSADEKEKLPSQAAER